MSLVKVTKNQLTKSESVSGAVGKGMVAAGTGGIALTLAASLIPFLGVFGLSLVLLVLGAFFWE